jgi:hypothetical protein
MAAFQFLAGENFAIDNVSNSGIGFYGASFGASVLVGEYQTTSFITNGAGTTQGAQVDNVKFLNSASGIVGSSTSGIALTAIPNYQATLNIRFTHGSAVKVQNVKLRIYDRSNINNNPSGLTCKVAQIIHPTITQINDGSGDTSWTTAGGSGSVLTLANSPGISGLMAGNGSDSTHSSTQHDWYCVISASPDSVGSKSQFGLYCECDYL